MAVEIPVYVDIKGAFDQAANEIPKEIPKLEKALSSAALKIDFKGFNMRELLTGDVEMHDLRQSLHAIRSEFEAVISGTQKARRGMNVNNLIKSYTLLEQRITGTYNKFTPLAMQAEATIGKINSKIKKLQDTLQSARPGSDAFNKTNYELQLQRQRLVEVQGQLMKYKAGIDSTSKSLSKQNSLLKNMAGYFSGMYAVHTALRFVKQIRDVTGELEYQRVALGHLIGDVQAGNELFNKTVEAAKESPFRITQLVTYTKQLAAYRIEQENLFDTTQRLADISAGLGVDMNRLILAYGQVRAASVLRGQELRQFTEAGIPLVDELAKKFRELGREGTTTADVFKLISERAVPFSMIKDIFNDLTKAGGMFYKMQEEQAKTLKGRWEKLKDAYDQALMSIGENDTFQAWNNTVLNSLNGIAKSLKGIIRVVNAATVSWVAYKTVTAIVRSDTFKLTAAYIKEIGVINTLKMAVGSLTLAWKKFLVVLKANWVTWLLAAIPGIITFFTTFKNKNKEATEALSDMQVAINNLKNANKDFDYGKDLIDTYEKLSNKTERTNFESKTLATTVEELNRLYPELTDKMNDNNTSMDEKITLLKELAKTQHEQAVKEAKERLKTQAGVVADLEEQLAVAKAEKEAAEARRRRAESEQEIQWLREKSSGLEKGSTEYSKQLAKNTQEAAKAAKAAEGAYDKIAIELAEARGEMEALRKIVYPEEATKGMQQWAKELKKVQDEMVGVGEAKIFQDDELEKFTSVYDFSRKLKKVWTDLKESLKGMNAEYDKMVDKQSAAATALWGEIQTKQKQFDIAEAMRLLLGLDFSKPSGRDTRLSQLKSDISELTNAYKKLQELRKYKTEEGAIIDINTLFPQLKGEVPSLDYVVSELEKRLEQVKADLKKSPKSKTLLDMKRTLETEISNLKFDDLKNELEKKLKKVSEEVKRSEAARNFYKDIFDLTGDETLATSLSVEVYGGIGDEFKERLQQQLAALFEGVEVDDAMQKAIDTQDFDYIFANLPEGMEKVREELKKLREDNEKFSADQIKTWVNELKKAKTYGDERVRIARTTQERIAEINRSNLKDAEKAKLVEQYARKEAEDVAKLQYEAFKDSPMYVQMFSDLDNATEGMLRTMRNRIAGLMESWKDLDPVQLKEMQGRLQEIDAQLAKKNPFKLLSDSMERYNNLMKKGRSLRGDTLKMQKTDDNLRDQQEALEMSIKRRDAAKMTADAAELMFGADSAVAVVSKQNLKIAEQAVEDQAKLTDEAKESADAAARNADEWKEIQTAIQAARAEIEGYTSVITELGDVVQEALSVFVSDDAANYARRATEIFGTFADSLKNIAAAAVQAETGNIAGVFQSAASGVLGLVSAGFKIADMINQAQLDEMTKEMAAQDKIIHKLERSYDRLGEAMDRAFGSDYLYNYNEQMKLLLATQDAYRKQMEVQQNVAENASREADRNAAKDAVEELKESIEDVDTQMADLRRSATEFFAGTDLTSAAEAFADSWLDAYREFGDTTGAIKEKMQEMIDNLIVKSVLAGAAKAILQPFFDEIEKLGKANDLTPENIAKLATMLNGKVQGINDSMSSIMTVLQSLGIKTRGQIGSFTGIARDIASASEESILGLAAGINTQNYYMSYVPMIHTNLEQVLALMGGSPTTPTVAPSAAEEGPAMPSVQEMIYDHLPNIDRNLADIKQMLSDVIKPVGTSASKYVATRM